MSRKKILPEKCKIENCGQVVYAKDLCHKHYVRLRVTGTTDERLKVPLITKNCEICGKSFSGRLSEIKDQRTCSMKCGGKLRRGENNCNWNDGVAEYPNHYQMKKSRLVKLQETGGRCECCGKKPKNTSDLEIHHKDGNKANHSPENIQLLYFKCHKKLHRGRINKPYNCKFVKLVGQSTHEIAQEYNISTKVVRYCFHKVGRENLFAELNRLREWRNTCKSKIIETPQPVSQFEVVNA